MCAYAMIRPKGSCHGIVERFGVICHEGAIETDWIDEKVRNTITEISSQGIT